MVLNCRAKQIENVIKLLNLNEGALAGKPKESVYKVLILDPYTKDVLAPLLRVSDLRKHGVTLHLMLDADRQPIPDVPAIYFIKGSQEACDRLVEDAKNDLYEDYYVNFASSCSRTLLEQFAASAVRAGVSQKFKQIYDQYLSFAALEAGLFSLSLPRCYLELNDNTAVDTQIEATVNAVVEGLFCTLATMQVVPVIKAPRGETPAMFIAQRLEARLRDALKGRANLFSESSTGLSASLSRPLLVLFDRDLDLAMMAAHTWTYKPLVQDVLGMKLNKITVAAEAATPSPMAQAPGAAATKSYEVDEKDFFWVENGAKPFPEVAAAVETSLRQYKDAADRINRQAGGGGGEPGGAVDHSKNTEQLMAAVNSLPQLTGMKRVLDKHTNLATTLLGAIKSRGIDAYHNLEEDLLAGKGDMTAVHKVLEGSKGSPLDKMRAALVALLAADGLPPDADLERMEKILRGTGIDCAPFNYVLRARRFGLAGAGGPQGPAAPGSESTTGLTANLGALAGRSHGDLLKLAKGTFAEGLTQVTKGVKSLLSGQRQAAVTVALDSLLENREGAEESFMTFDPRSRGASAPPGAKGPFKDVMVFMVGGGNYAERAALSSWAARAQPPRSVVYGCTELLSGEEFMQQLGELGRKSGCA